MALHFLQNEGHVLLSLIHRAPSHARHWHYQPLQCHRLIITFMYLMFWPCWLLQLPASTEFLYIWHNVYTNAQEFKNQYFLLMSNLNSQYLGKKKRQLDATCCVLFLVSCLLRCAMVFSFPTLMALYLGFWMHNSTVLKAYTKGVSWSFHWFQNLLE